MLATATASRTVDTDPRPQAATATGTTPARPTMQTKTTPGDFMAAIPAERRAHRTPSRTDCGVGARCGRDSNCVGDGG